MRTHSTLIGRMAATGVIVALALIGAACGGDGGASDATPAPPTSGTTAQATTATTDAAAGSVELVVTFDPSGCTYSGPDRATLDDEIRLSLVNETENAVRVGLELIPPDRLGEFAPLVGTDFDYPAEMWIQPAMYADAGPLSQKSARAYLAGSGTYLVNCVLREGPTPIHSWWPDVVEVTR